VFSVDLLGEGVDVPAVDTLHIVSVAPASITVGRQVTDKLEFKIMGR